MISSEASMSGQFKLIGDICFNIGEMNDDDEGREERWKDLAEFTQG